VGAFTDIINFSLGTIDKATASGMDSRALRPETTA
jgi:hypothetical protein